MVRCGMEKDRRSDVARANVYFGLVVSILTRLAWIGCHTE